MTQQGTGLAAAVLVLMSAVGCGGNDGPTAPSATGRGALVATPETQGRRTAGGWSLALALRLHESGGTPVTVHSATIALLGGDGAVGVQQTVPNPVGGTNRLAAGQELMAPTVTFESGDGRPYPAAVRVAVQYTDDNGQAGTSQGTAVVQGLPPLVTVFGVVRYGPSSVPIAAATVRIEGGAQDGRTVTTDDNGYYSLGQVSGPMRLWFSAIGVVQTSVDLDATRDTRRDVALFPPRR